MEENEIKLSTLVATTVIVIMLSITIIASIAMLTQFSKATRTRTIDNRNMSTDIDGLNNTVEVRFGTSGQFPFLQDLDGCFNASDHTTTLTKNTHYTFTEGDVNGGYVILTDAGSAVANDTGLNCSEVTYLADSDAQAASDVFIIGIGIFGSFIGILVIGVIGKVLLGMFKN